MTVSDVTASVFTAIFFGNLITAKIVGLSWLTWSETAVILIGYMAFIKLVAVIYEVTNKDKED